MTKRTLATLLILVIVLPAVISAGSVLFAPESPFASFDAAWESSISAALGESDKNISGSTDPLPESNRYIVKFKSEVSLYDIGDALKSVPYRQLAESEHRIFAVSDENKSFINGNAEIIDYFEPDLVRGTLAQTNDPAVMPAYDHIGIYTAWDTVRGSNDIIVAVLDTGVDRTHEDLADANILPGYDAVNRKSGVNDDPVGHGTGVIGIIAATADNGIGIAGVAHGVSVLPVKISASSTTIYSSDLISGIRFAANAGAKVINMSVGGYSSSYAEQEAVDYAISKGCILISAAGNGGNLPYADQKSYPASYNGVISVASCAPDGERSSFSQYNDSVDVAAPGEAITMPFVENQESVYRTDSGTSYSCALVSGIAALAASHIDSGARFGNDEFLALITDTCGQTRSDELGYGIINAASVIEIVNLPIITGVSDGGIYHERVKVGFNRGTAVLDGEPFEDGDAIIANGKHVITVTDGENIRSVGFRLDYDPLSFEFKEFAAFACFEFDRGAALLDGFPYASGDRITASGNHRFVLTDGDERIEKEFALQYTLPTVYGIEDGGVYSKPVNIRIVGDGTAELDGQEVYGSVSVAGNGAHTLTVRSGNGAVSAEYSFEIDFPDALITDTDYAMGKAAVDEENGYFCLYGDSLVGVRVYDIDSPEAYLSFLPIGRVYSHRFSGENLILLGDDGVTVIDRANALDPEAAVKNTYTHENISLYTFAEDEIFCFDEQNIYRLNTESGQPEFLADIGFECETAMYSDGLLCLMAPSTDRLVRIFSLETNEFTSFTLNAPFSDAPACFGEGYLAVGNSLIDIRNGETVLEFCSYAAIKIENGVLFAENVMIDIASGKETGSFPFLVSDIVFGNEAVYIFGAEPIFARIANGPEGVAAYGAAEPTDRAFSAPEIINAYRTNIFCDIYSSPISAAANENTVFAVFFDKNILYGFGSSDLTEISAVALRFTPEKILLSGGYIIVSFANVPKVYIAPETDPANGIYISLPAKCVSACVSDGKMYAVSGGKLFYCAVDGSGTVVTSISASDVAARGDHIYILDETKLALYTPELLPVAQITVNGDSITVADGIIVGGTVYDTQLTSDFAQISEKLIAAHGQVFVSKNGIFDILTSQRIGSHGIEDPKNATISGNAVVVFGDNIISVSSYDDISDIVTVPSVEGISDGGVYIGEANIGYSHGIGYLDGEPIMSDTVINDVGEHVFTLSLPFGESISVRFTIEARIEEIGFLVPNTYLSVGETLSLGLKYLPEGASSVPVTYSCDSDGIILSDMGEVTAVTVGVYTVTATAKTDYGTFSAQCTITVRDDLITFLPDSGLQVDRNNRFLLGVKPGTTADELLAMFPADKKVAIFDSKGIRLKGIVASGHTVTLYGENGTITDSLTVSIKGDTDGDGFITAYDMYVLERILRNQQFDRAFVNAGDINGNGVVADNDYRALRNIVLHRTDASVGTPQNNLFGLSSVQTVSHIESGDIIDVAVCISGSKYARGISGVISFSEGLEFVESGITSWDGDCRDIGGNRVAFYVYGSNGENCGKAFMVLINLRFRVTAQAGRTVTVTSEGLTASFETGARVIRFEPADLFVYEHKTGDLLIEFLNAYSFEFDPDTHVYQNVVIPYNAALADIIVTRNIGQTVSISGLAIPDSGSGTVTVNVTDADGSAELYTIHVRRDKEPRFDTNCHLAMLEVEGYRLTPSFAPEVTEYSISVPYGTEKIDVHCAAQNPTAQVIIGDTALYGETTPVTVTVSSPDGESLIYTINVTVLPQSTESSVAAPPTDDDSGLSPIYIAAVACIAVAAIALIAFALRCLGDAQNADESESAEENDSEDRTEEK